ncbi:uncharacterized protein [Nicotiana sylvestris]|uniref:uncharacterized protein n=1 Tax=Nicotiana sylvestris TaxID=4096 RepID=UPI00388C3B84
MTDYEARYSELSRHSLMILPTDGERVQRFIAGLHSGIRANMTREVEMGTPYQPVVEIARRIEGYRLRGREKMQQNKRARFSGEFRGALARGKAIQGSSSGYSGPEGSSGSYFSAMTESLYRPMAIQASSSGSTGHKSQPSGQQVTALWGCFECGNLGHMRRYCPRLRGKTRRGQPDTASSGGGQPAGAPVRFYALPARRDTLASEAVIIVITPEPLGTPIHVSTLMCDYVVVDWIYRSCVVTFCGFKTRTDLMLLDMIDFEIILGMDWLSSYHAVLHCHAKTITLAMSGLPRLEWKDSEVDTSNQFISFLKARHMVEKGVWLIWILFGTPQ